MGYRTQADLDEALRTGTVADATVTGDAESNPLDSDPGSPGLEAGTLAHDSDALAAIVAPSADDSDTGGAAPEDVAV